MAKKSYVGINNKSKAIPDIGYVGIANKSKKLAIGYIGDENGKSKQFWPGITYDGMIFFKGQMLRRSHRYNILCLPALARYPYCGCIIDSHAQGDVMLRDLNGLLLASLGADNGNVLWTGQGYPFLRWESYATSHWQYDAENYFYKIEQGSDFRSENYFYIPIDRIYVDVQKSSGVYFFDFEVEAKGQSNLYGQGVSVWMQLCCVKNGKLYSIGYASFTTQNTGTFDKYTARCSLPWDYDPSEELYIDYISFEAETSVTGVVNDIYIQSVKLLNYRYKNCFLLDYFQLDKEYNVDIDDYSPVLPVGKNSLKIVYDGITFEHYKESGDDDVYIGYTYNLVQYGSASNPLINAYITLVAISKKPFSVSLYVDTPFDGLQRITKQSEYNDSLLGERYYYMRPTSMYSWTIRQSPYKTPDFSYIPDAPVGDVPPMQGDAAWLYYTVPNRMSKYLIRGRYYDGLIHRQATHPIDAKTISNIPQPIPINIPVLWQYYGGYYNQEYVKTKQSDVWLVITSYTNAGSTYYDSMYFSEKPFSITDDYTAITHQAVSLTYEGKTYYRCNSELHLSKPTPHEGMAYDYEVITDINIITQQRAIWEIAYIIFDGTITEYET